jgi:hypothetical protein
MRLLRVDRSPVRLFLFGLVGLFLMLGAVDVMWGHWVATPPDTFNEEITSKGRNQRRADYVWGAFLLAGGAGIFVFSVTALIRRSPALLVQDDGLAVAMGSPGDEPVFIPWSTISFVSSGAQKNPNGGYDRDVLVVDVVDPAGLPAEPWGASWDGNRLVVDAGGWDKPIGEVVIHAGIALDRYQHFEGPRQVAIGRGDAAVGSRPPPTIDPEEIKDD